MTVEQLLSRAREAAVVRTEEYYKEICEGCCDYKQEIENDKLTGEYQSTLRMMTLECIDDVKRTICKTTLITDEQKKQVISEINKCPEIVERRKRVAMIFANHFVRYKDVYLK